MSVSSSSWGLGRAAVCDCGTPWTFLLPFFYDKKKEKEKKTKAKLHCDLTSTDYTCVGLSSKSKSRMLFSALKEGSPIVSDLTHSKGQQNLHIAFGIHNQEIWWEYCQTKKI